MSVLNGFDAARQIKSFKKNLPIVAIIAYAMSGDETRAKEAGCDDYMPKPMDLKKLEKIIYNHFPGEKLKLSI